MNEELAEAEKAYFEPQCYQDYSGDDLLDSSSCDSGSASDSKESDKRSKETASIHSRSPIDSERSCEGSMEEEESEEEEDSDCESDSSLYTLT